MTLGEFVAMALYQGGLPNVYSVPPSADECAEPIVCGLAAFDRVVSARKHRRGEAKVTVRVCRVDAREGYEAACECERALNRASWLTAVASRVRVCGLECGMPYFEKVDESGRYVWAVDATVTVEVADAQEG